MKTSLRIALATVISLLVLAGPAVARTATSEQTHPIEMDRPMKPGQQFEFSGESMISQTSSGVILGNSVSPQQVKYVLRMKSRMTVDRVDEHGRPTASTHEIRSCTARKDGAEYLALQAGSKLVAELRGTETHLTLDGNVIEGEDKVLFETVAGLQQQAPTDGQLYGTTEPRKVGETWPIAHGLLLEDFRRQTSTPIEAEKLTGTSTLVAVEAAGTDRSSVKVLTEITLDGAILGLQEMPPGSKLEQASTSIKLQGVYPCDTTLPWTKRSALIDLHVVVTQETGTLVSDTQVVANLMIEPVGTGTGTVATVPSASTEE